ncbi:MAG TPA: ribonuclease III [Gammaproteobacteria bacterium]|nr:ribonuclease III [Gammaproteobacteria bacterium]
MTDEAERFAERIGYRFADPGLIALALAHRSSPGASNERLEFLGDAVINLAIAEVLYRRLPELDEGALTRLRASLVNGEMLAAVARELDLGAFLRLGAGEQKSGGAMRASILADAFEAVLGAVFVDGGYAAARALLRRLFDARLRALPDAQAVKDAKTRLQELLQARGLGLPDYALAAAEGPEHARRFVAECRVRELDLRASGAGSSRRDAEQAAAGEMLARLDS